MYVNFDINNLLEFFTFVTPIAPTFSPNVFVPFPLPQIPASMVPMPSIAIPRLIECTGGGGASVITFIHFKNNQIDLGKTATQRSMRIIQKVIKLKQLFPLSYTFNNYYSHIHDYVGKVKVLGLAYVKLRTSNHWVGARTGAGVTATLV